MKKIDLDLQIAGISVKGTIYIEEEKAHSVIGKQYSFHFPDSNSQEETPTQANTYNEQDPLIPHDTKKVIVNGIKARLCKWEFDTCFTKVYTRGYCSKHYQRVWRQERGGEN